MGLLDLLKRLIGVDVHTGKDAWKQWCLTKPRAGALGIDELARRLGVRKNKLLNVRIKYIEKRIAKRGGGVRRVMSPCSELKAMQKLILNRLLAKRDSHEAAMAYEKGRSIVQNAQLHESSGVVVKMDLRDFFAQTKQGRVKSYFYGIGWDEQAAEVLVQICCHQGGLPTGSPVSGRLSNLVNYEIDVRLSKMAQAFEASYSRYADDLTFSMGDWRKAGVPEGLSKVDYRQDVSLLIWATIEIVRQYGYWLHVDRKLQVRYGHERQEVTGLVVNEKAGLSREKKRWLRAVKHRLETTGRASLTAQQVAGWESYVKMIQKGDHQQS